MDLFEKFMMGVMLTLVALLIALIVLAFQENAECEASGGVMRGTGEYYTTVVMVGKVAVPQTNEEMACFK